jgi:hypothetical protein
LEGENLNTPSGFEPVGQGSLGIDPAAVGRYVSPGGAHVIFFSKARLEEDAAPTGTVAIYDRAAGNANSEVVSVKPDGSPFGAGQNADYVASTEDGTAVLFSVGGALYLHREGATTEVAAAPQSFAGIAENGKRVFYATTTGSSTPAVLYACDVQAGPCAGPGAHAAIEIASNSRFVNVAPDGSAALFTSNDALPGTESNEHGEAAEAGKLNLYAWDEANPIRFVSQLAPKDFVSFNNRVDVNLGAWKNAVGTSPNSGRSLSPTRSDPSGDVFVFQSHAQLTAYDNEGSSEIYRYDLFASPTERLTCVSCDPTGAPAGGDAMLDDTENGIDSHTVIANVTDDGEEVFFESVDRLLPEDANSVSDVYEWKAKGFGGCARDGGCLALISSGQGESDSYLYGMSADGHDVFFRTSEKLVAADVPGSPSIYDARIDGGIPDSPAAAPCQGDACQGQGSGSPTLPPTATTGAGNGNEEPVPPTKNCAKGKHRVKGRCIPHKHHKKQRKHRANHKRRVSR